MYNHKFNKVWFGIVIGTILPILAYGILFTVFDSLTESGQILGVRLRTTQLFAICANIIPFQWFRKKRWDDAMRGMVFPVIALASYWIYLYHGILGMF